MSELNNSYIWQGREDLEDGEKGLRWHQAIKQEPIAGGATLIGFACDLGVQANKGRIGAKLGPDKIRDALANLAWHSSHPLSDTGTIVAKKDLTSSQQAYSTQVSKSLNERSLVIGLGGGHEIAWASYMGLRQHLNSTAITKKIGIINFDAHFDLRKPSPNPSSGTPFWQISEYCKQQKQDFHYACLGVSQAANTHALFNMAATTNTLYLQDIDCTMAATIELISPMLKEIDELYVTICLDAFPTYLAPGVSAPSALGISPQFVIAMLRWLSKSQEEFNYSWRLSDVAEMNPLFDIDNRTAKLAARLIFEILAAKSE